MTDSQKVDWTALAILAMFYGECSKIQEWKEKPYVICNLQAKF